MNTALALKHYREEETRLKKWLDRYGSLSTRSRDMVELDLQIVTANIRQLEKETNAVLDP